MTHATAVLPKIRGGRGFFSITHQNIE